MAQPIDQDREREWVAGLRSGRLDIFRTIFETYESKLLYFACLWVPRAVGEEIVQEVFFDLWQRRAGLNIEEGSFGAFLFSAIRNHVFKYIRHDKVVHQVRSTYPADTPPGMSRGPGAPDGDLLTTEIREQIAEAMVSLSEVQRAVLMLRWAEDMSFAQVATALSISENAARIHATRGRQALHVALRPLFDE